ncbi:MAG TPA: 6-phosphofructokinase, partial [Spirochaetales bacterium]|nr:6-phosphofructokinase [Spirochaetales bacterium]
MSDDINFTVPDLGARTVRSPLAFSLSSGDAIANYVDDADRVRWNSSARVSGDAEAAANLLEKAGPRERLYFNPAHVHAGVVTCGGLCPGLNDVIRALVRCLWNRYGVRRVSGVRFGYKGFLPEYGLPVKELTPDVVDDIHKIGGTILGSSRGGGERTAEIVDAIERMNLNVLFAIGGDGTQKGAMA